MIGISGLERETTIYLPE